MGLNKLIELKPNQKTLSFGEDLGEAPRNLPKKENPGCRSAGFFIFHR